RLATRRSPVAFRRDDVPGGTVEPPDAEAEAAVTFPSRSPESARTDSPLDPRIVAAAPDEVAVREVAAAVDEVAVGEVAAAAETEIVDARILLFTCLVGRFHGFP